MIDSSGCRAAYQSFAPTRPDAMARSDTTSDRLTGRPSFARMALCIARATNVPRTARKG
jgi:hypothetical protein